MDVKADGTIVWNRKTVSSTELIGRLKQLSADFPDYAIILRGDKDAKYEYIVNLMDICRQANIWNVAFATRKAE